MICDVHAHLDLFAADELSAILERAEAAGVTDIIMNSLEPNTYAALERIKTSYAGPVRLRLAAGCYPLSGLEADVEAGILDDVETDPDRALAFIEANGDGIVAIGEVGLDFTGTNEEQRERDERIFERVLVLAERLDLPVIIHSRRAEARVIELLEAHPNVRAVLHCFGGKLKLAERALERRRTWFSIPVIVEHAEQFQRLVDIVPDNRLLTETDAPFLSPKDADHSEPAHITRSIDAIAQRKGLDPKEMELILYQNARTLFRF